MVTTQTACFIVPTNEHRLLIIEPYWGGSHRAFLEGLRRRLEIACTLLTLPPRKWKMRMQLAAFWAAERIEKMAARGEVFDAALCSTFLDVAALRAQLCRRGIHLPLAVYFHENQFSYPGQVDDPGRYQFTAINFASAMAADSLAFNSRYNLASFLTGVRQYLKKAADMDLTHLAEAVAAKSRVLYPGIDFSAIDEAPTPLEKADKPVIVWNHRWEHDKDPEAFFRSLFALSDAGADFGLIVLGEQFASCPEIFTAARERLSPHVLHFGYEPSRQAYARQLKRGDIVVSTARQEFFGMAVLEAVRAGCRPLVPDNLAYREIYPPDCRYKQGTLTAHLKILLENNSTFHETECRGLTDRFAWPAIIPDYHRWLTPLLKKNTLDTG
jgi:glycosyltransferase involved in cell wall biosynthesis